MGLSNPITPKPGVEELIRLVRGQKVILGHDQAGLYGVETRVLMQAVKRNVDRFPEDFAFQLTWYESERAGPLVYNADKKRASKSQIVILKRGGNIKYRPYAFTEQGVAMLSSVLRSSRAVQVNIEIMRTFVRLRQVLSAHKGLARKLAELEKKYDGQFRVVFEAIRKLMESPPVPARPRIGFRPESRL
ncbi:MAG: ORF6N domain-containing protein [Elusimicrobia bacterium]|nr:ORF6N domain-containing protein [Elusimicrobiota bacterium]